MNETWFYTNTWSNQIARIAVSKFTDSSVWVGGRRTARKTFNQLYAPTWDEAHAFLLEYWGRQVLAARRQLESVNDKLGNVKGMKQAPSQETAVCQHDLQKPNPTVQFLGSSVNPYSTDWIAHCTVCDSRWNHPMCC